MDGWMNEWVIWFILTENKCIEGCMDESVYKLISWSIYPFINVLYMSNVYSYVHGKVGLDNSIIPSHIEVSE